jgi:hypothetical protein
MLSIDRYRHREIAMDKDIAKYTAHFQQPRSLLTPDPVYPP